MCRSKTISQPHAADERGATYARPDISARRVCVGPEPSLIAQSPLIGWRVPIDYSNVRVEILADNPELEAKPYMVRSAFRLSAWSISLRRFVWHSCEIYGSSCECVLTGFLALKSRAIETKLSEVEEGRGSTLEQRDVCVA